MPSSKMSKVKVCSVILPGQEDLKETLVFKIRTTENGFLECVEPQGSQKHVPIYLHLFPMRKN